MRYALREYEYHIAASMTGDDVSCELGQRIYETLGEAEEALAATDVRKTWNDMLEDSPQWLREELVVMAQIEQVPSSVGEGPVFPAWAGPEDYGPDAYLLLGYKEYGYEDHLRELEIEGK